MLVNKVAFLFVDHVLMRDLLTPPSYHIALFLSNTAYIWKVIGKKPHKHSHKVLWATHIKHGNYLAWESDRQTILIAAEK